ncbi:MAG: GntR family transcriptional regulator [Paracoccus sp. (in: a-proteobacteria)]|uniref:GntR family transcriptional regulator n=1 Tax=Paracoccus sp. TaxID=267 RepID=UPI0039E6EEAE
MSSEAANIPQQPPARAPVAAVSELPAAAQMHAALRKRIISGELQPGQRLSEQDVAGQYDLSRQPVREAFIRLAGEGLLEVRPQRGTFITRINMEWVLDTRFIRESVEADITRIAARLAQAPQIDQLNRILGLQAGLGQDDHQTIFALDEEFHSTLAAIAGKSLVWTHLHGLKIHLDRVRHLVSAMTPPDVMLEQHRNVVEAIAERDPDKAEALMRLHLRRVFEDLPAIVQLSPELFEQTEPGLARMHYDLSVNV